MAEESISSPLPPDLGLEAWDVLEELQYRASAVLWEWLADRVDHLAVRVGELDAARDREEN